MTNIKVNLNFLAVSWCKFQKTNPTTVEPHWLEQPWDYENLFETGVVRVIEGLF